MSAWCDGVLRVTWGSEAVVRWGSTTASRAQITLQHGVMAQESFCFAPTKHLSWLQSRPLMRGQVSGEQAPNVCAVQGGEVALILPRWWEMLITGR